MLAFRWGMARRAQLNWPVMVMSRQRSHSSGSISSTRPVGPAMPALLTRQSRPPSVATASSIRRATWSRSDTSQKEPVAPGALVARLASASLSMSQTCTLAPSARKAFAVTRPMPPAPAVMSTRKPLMPRSMSFSQCGWVCACQFAAFYLRLPGHAALYAIRDAHGCDLAGFLGGPAFDRVLPRASHRQRCDCRPDGRRARRLRRRQDCSTAAGRTGRCQRSESWEWD